MEEKIKVFTPEDVKCLLVDSLLETNCHQDKNDDLFLVDVDDTVDNEIHATFVIVKDDDIINQDKYKITIERVLNYD